MESMAKRLGIFGSLGLLIWGSYLVIATLIGVPGMRGAPGLIGPYAAVFGGAILIFTAVIAFFASLLITKFPLTGGGILLPVCFIVALAAAMTYLSLWLLVSVPLAIILITSCVLALKADPTTRFNK